MAYVLFSIFNVIWATVYLETWKRRGAELAYRWGTLDQRDDLLIEPRPLFTVKSFAKKNKYKKLTVGYFCVYTICQTTQGVLEISPVTGRLEPTCPSWKRNVCRYFVSVPIVAVCLLFVFIVMILSFQIQVNSNNNKIR